MNKDKLEIREEYYNNGQLHYKAYYINDTSFRYHNPNGPAREQYYDNGQLSYKAYCINGQRHNPNGPAYESYYSNGQLDFKYYYISDKQLSYKDFCIWQFENNIIDTSELFKRLLLDE